MEISFLVEWEVTDDADLGGLRGYVVEFEEGRRASL
jgi:hypothetical protein